jgi:hypothetical protein
MFSDRRIISAIERCGKSRTDHVDRAPDRVRIEVRIALGRGRLGVAEELLPTIGRLRPAPAPTLAKE